ncbi:MAG TPA: RNA polymerase sigma factor, partial [Candidatus Dormibacteraeota bacterium]|nr:RNA polymerase sigma factor [Candidatus Dormibacteraeota bacterium]
MAEPEHLPVAAARAGSPEAWDALYRRYQLPLYVYVVELLHHEAASLDVVQETFINAARHLAGLREDAKFGSWLFGIAHQKCVQHWRKHNREVLVAEFSGPPLEGLEAETPEDILLRQERAEELMKLLNELPAPQRSVLLLHFIEGFSIEDIADITATHVKGGHFGGGRPDRQFTDLQVWKAAFAVLSAGGGGGARPEFDPGKLDAASRAEAAPAVLDGLKVHEAAFTELQAASRRPFSRYP